MKTFIKNINKLSNKLREVCDFEENHKLVISHIEDRMELFEETPDCEELKELRAEKKVLEDEISEKNLELTRFETEIMDQYINILESANAEKEAKYIKSIRLNMVQRGAVLNKLLDEFAGVEVI